MPPGLPVSIPVVLRKQATPSRCPGQQPLMRPFSLTDRRYASLYFCVGIDNSDNELLALEIIHRYVELLDEYDIRALSPLLPPPLRAGTLDILQRCPAGLPAMLPALPSPYLEPMPVLWSPPPTHSPSPGPVLAPQVL